MNLMMVSTRVMVAMAMAFLIYTAAWDGVAGDADSLQDFCILTKAGTCKAAEEVVAADFWSNLLAAPPANRTQGVTASLASAANVAGLNEQGLSLLRIDYAAGGGAVVAPHVHPRASEVIYVLAGTLHAGFVDTSGALFSRVLAAGELFVVPRGLVHFIFNAGDAPAASLSALNSQNPGASFLPSALFATRPSLPDSLLQHSFALSPAQLRLLRHALAPRH